MANRTKVARYVKTIVPHAGGNIEIYASPLIASAMEEFLKLDIYQGAKVSLLFGAIYEQGKKDGAKVVKDSFGKMMLDIPHENPGRPKKKKK
jgi:hypothetical protein